MKPLIPQSEDFFYWAPEEICNYPVPPGPEDDWFTNRTALERRVAEASREHDHE
jgi:hypothetical protein